MATRQGTPVLQDRAGLYVRVSLDRAAHGMADEILSPDTQEARGRAYCEAQGWQIEAVERDIDESAYRQHYSQRPGLMRLLQAVGRRELSKLVVWKFSRLSRRLKEFLEICDRVEAAGAGVVSVTEQIDTSTPAGRLIRNILASFAQFQSEELSEQISANWMTKVRRGERPAGHAPYGTRNERGVLVPDPDTHCHLVEMYHVFAETNSISAVYRYLVRNAATPPISARWNLNTIRLILQNPVYTGRLEWLGEAYEARWEPLVPPDLWAKAQAHFASRRVGRRQLQRLDARMLSGIAKCGACGRNMWIKFRRLTARSPTASDRVYQCLAPQNTGTGCDVPALDAGEAERAVWDLAVRLVSLSGVMPMVEETTRQQIKACDHRDARLSALLTQRDRTERAAARLIDLLVEGRITDDQFRRHNHEYMRRLEAIEVQLANVPPACPEIDPESVRNAAQIAPQAATAAEQRAVLLTMGAQVVVTQYRVHLVLPGLCIQLPARLLGNVFHFGEHYQRLSYQGPVLTDKQKAFIQRTYRWANKQALAARLGRPYRALVTQARGLGVAPARQGSRGQPGRSPGESEGRAKG